MGTIEAAEERRRPRLGSVGGIGAATVVLFLLSPLLAPNVLSKGSLLSMLPFAAILALAAAGQTLVVQQGGIDLSVAGTISMAAAIVTTYPAGDGSKLPVALVLVLLSTALAGCVTGLAVTVAGLSPVVATLGMNALLLGVNVRVSGGSGEIAPENLSDFAIAKFLGIPNTLIVAVLILGATSFFIKRTTFGRRFEAIGASGPAARASGLSTRRYVIGAYIAASVLYGLAGVLLSGFVRIPSVTAGNDYLLPSIAAVVIGGTSLLGGIGSVVASGIGALFLSQLDQVTLAMGAGTAVQNITQAVIIALGMIIQVVPWARARRSRFSSRKTAGTDDVNVDIGQPASSAAGSSSSSTEAK